jgi:hypothetical protein
MNAIETIRKEWGGDGRFEAVISILPDCDPPRPDDCDCEPQFFQARSGAHLRTEAAATFGHERWDRQEPTEKALSILQRIACGEVIKEDDGSWYYGVAEYRHSGSVFALCCSEQHQSFPDQRWDVIGLCGWIKITRQNRIDWGIHGRKGVDELARKNAEGCLEEWTAFVNGWHTGYRVELRQDGRLVEDDSCWGFQDIEDAKEAAGNAVLYWQRQYPPAAETGCVAP